MFDPVIKTVTDSWGTISSLISGGAILKGIEFCWGAYGRRRDKKRTAKEFVDTHLSPLLKSADELMGKLHSLVKRDFTDLNFAANDPKRLALPYLFARFWAQIEIIRQEGLSVSLTEESRGERLISFLDCLESEGARIVDRTGQRAIGEITLESRDGVWPLRSFTSFVSLIENDSNSARWLKPLEEAITPGPQTNYQRLAHYGVVLNAMIDDLDPDHHVTHKRPPYTNKLSKKTWTDLKFRVFGTYLKFVKKPERYYGPKRW
jgi:hypothetical protein